MKTRSRHIWVCTMKWTHLLTYFVFPWQRTGICPSACIIADQALNIRTNKSEFLASFPRFSSLSTTKLCLRISRRRSSRRPAGIIPSHPPPAQTTHRRGEVIGEGEAIDQSRGRKAIREREGIRRSIEGSTSVNQNVGRGIRSGPQGLPVHHWRALRLRVGLLDAPPRHLQG